MITVTRLVSSSGSDCDVVDGGGVVVGTVVVPVKVDVFAGLVFELEALLLDLLELVEVGVGATVAVTLSVVMMVEAAPVTLTVLV